MVNTQDDVAGNSVSISRWSGFDQLRLTDDSNAVNVTIGSADRWDRAHLRRLRQSADLPGLVPVIDSDFASDGKPFAVTPLVQSPTLADRIPPSGSDWQICAAITEAAARATHEAHIRGLFHGSLSPDQIFVLEDDVAVSGIGLGLGGNFGGEYAAWVAPEVLDGNDATERSDVYSLGKILEASLGGSLENVPRSVRRLIMWSSSDTPEARPPSALEFASILAEALGDDRPTFSPAFIATAEANDLASTASESVAAFVPSASTGAAASAAAAVGGAGAAAAAVSAIGDDVEGDDAPADEVEEAPADEVEVADEATDDVTAEVTVEEVDDVEVDVPAEDGDVALDAVQTGEIPTDIEATAPTADDDTDIDMAMPEADAHDTTSVFDSRQYGEEMHAAADDDYDVPAAAQTVDLDETFQPEKRGNKAGILVGAILALGLGVVAFQLLNSGDDTTESATATSEADDTQAATDETTVTSEAVTDDTAEATTEDTADSSAGTVTEDEPETEDSAIATDDTATDDTATEDDAAATDDTATEDDTATDDTATEDDAATTDDTTAEDDAAADDAAADVEVAAPATMVDGPISVDDAALQILHGIPGVSADVYVNGEALAPGFQVGTIAGPATLDPGAYDVQIYAAMDDAPASAADRSDDPLIDQTVTVGADPATLVAHLDAEGNPMISTFAEQLDELAPAKGRVELRHLAAAPAVTASIDGEELPSMLEPGASTSVTLEAGEHTIETFAADGTPIKSATIVLADGELASVSIIGVAADNSIDAVIQRYTGLASAPVNDDDGVPAGNSNLLGAGEDPTGLYLVGALAALMAAAGGAMTLRRSRRVL